MEHERWEDASDHVFTVGIASSYTSDPLIPYLEEVLSKYEIGSAIMQAPYGQVAEVLLDSSSVLRSNSKGLNICLLRMSDWNRNRDSGRSLVHQTAAFVAAVQEYSHAGGEALLICLCPESNPERRDEQVESQLVAELEKVPGVAIHRDQNWFDAYGIEEPFDDEADELAHIPLTEEAFATLAIGVGRVVKSLKTKPRKVIAVDCDYTLWEGACGDLPPEELVFSDRTLAVQKFLRQKYEAGFILAICSRNDPPNVERVFAQRGAEFLVRREHFITTQINWNPKWENIQAIADELNVGVDSVILVDDDPFVCAQTSAHRPEVAVVQVPVQQDGERILRQRLEFDRFFITNEDRKRNDSYRADHQRRRVAAEVMSPQQLNERLQTQLSVQRAEPSHWRRIEQLVGRTNQFTLGTMRASDVGARLRAGGEAWVATLEDCFGDYGVVAIAMTSNSDAKVHVDSFAMSCRALHRGVEQALLERIRQDASVAGGQELSVRLHRTGRNHLARSFFSEVSESFVEQEHDDVYRIICSSKSTIKAAI